MISDAYTREYDERMRLEQAKKTLEAKISMIHKCAERFGCYAIVDVLAYRIITNVYMPNGTRLRRFNKLETVVAWAERWERNNK